MMGKDISGLPRDRGARAAAQAARVGTKLPRAGAQQHKPPPPQRAMGCDPSGSFALWSLQFGVNDNLTSVLLPPCLLLYTCCWMWSITSAGRIVLHEGYVSFAITEVTCSMEQHHHRFQSPQKQLVKVYQHLSYS